MTEVTIASMIILVMFLAVDYYNILEVPRKYRKIIFGLFGTAYILVFYGFLGPKCLVLDQN